MGLDQLLIQVAAFFLTLTGTPAVPAGSTIYLPGLGRSIRFEMGFADWTILFLLDVGYVFVVWTYLTVRGRSWSTSGYFKLGLLGCAGLFLEMGLKMSVQAYALVRTGSLVSGMSGTVGAADLMGEVGLLADCTVLGMMILSTCLAIRFRGRRVG